VLAALESATGAKWDAKHVNMEDEIRAGRKLLEEGIREGAVPLILSYFYREGMGADYARDVESANGVLDLPTESIEELVRGVVS